MNKALQTLAQIGKTKDLRNKLLFTFGILVIFRFAAHITIPGIDVNTVNAALANSEQGGAFQVFSLLTGGAMERFSIVLMGLTPYINASIIMQLLGVIVPSIENLKKEGEIGQKKINQYTRLLTLPIALLQSYGMLLFLNNFAFAGNPVIADTSLLAMLPLMLMVTAGTVFVMWIGELVNEKGIGNGISILIFAGIVSVVPGQIASAARAAEPAVLLGLGVATIAITLFIVYVMEADRRVPVVYSSRKGGGQQKSFLPLKIAQAGMIPIIFAVSLMTFPSILAQFFATAANPNLVAVSDWISLYMNPQSPTIWYNLLYAGLIFGFTFFYISIVFDPKKIADNIQKRNGFIPGFRPGTETENFLEQTTNRLAFWGGLFLALVAIAPLIFEKWIGGSNSVSLFVSGAGMIIVVSVVLDIIRRINAQLVMHDYDKL